MRDTTNFYYVALLMVTGQEVSTDTWDALCARYGAEYTTEQVLKWIRLLEGRG